MRGAAAEPKLTSKVIYRALSSEGAGWWGARGFVVSGDRSRWTRLLPDGHRFTLMFQIDKYGWSRTRGTKLTLNFFAYADEDRPFIQARYGDLLDDAGREALAEIHHRVMAKLARVSAATDAVDDEPDDMASICDPWLRIVDAADLVAWWKEFLEPRLDKLCERFFETGAATPTPLTRLVGLESLEVREDAGSSVISVSEDEAPALARELRALSAAAPRFSVVRTAAHFIFELRPQFRSGILDSALLGLAKRRRVWISLGPKAVAELADRAERPPVEEVTLLESSTLKFEVRAT